MLLITEKGQYHVQKEREEAKNLSAGWFRLSSWEDHGANILEEVFLGRRRWLGIVGREITAHQTSVASYDHRITAL